MPDDNQNVEQRMLGAVPGEPALGRGPAPDGDHSRHEYHHPAAGWGPRAAWPACSGRPGSRWRALAPSSR